MVLVANMRLYNDIAYELQLLLEYSSIAYDHVAGIALDRRKFFDLLPYDIYFNILTCFGAPHTILTAERLHVSAGHYLIRWFSR